MPKMRYISLSKVSSHRSSKNNVYTWVLLTYENSSSRNAIYACSWRSEITHHKDCMTRHSLWQLSYQFYNMYFCKVLSMSNQKWPKVEKMMFSRKPTFSTWTVLISLMTFFSKFPFCGKGRFSDDMFHVRNMKNAPIYHVLCDSQPWGNRVMSH